jgi:RNA polymerase sigma-70 factor (ECF subfamily)
VKLPRPGAHPPSEVSASASASATHAPSAQTESALDVTSIHRDHADFLWASLHRLGVRSADLEDALQEVLVVVHRRLGSYDRQSRITTWLFGICLRVAAAQRRRASTRREELGSDARARREPSDAPSPEDIALENDARRRLDAVLDAMDPEKRAIFVMFEIESIACSDIADMLGVPIGTVHSRLYAARKDFEKSVARLGARSRHVEARARGGGR